MWIKRLTLRVSVNPVGRCRPKERSAVTGKDVVFLILIAVFIIYFLGFGKGGG